MQQLLRTSLFSLFAFVLAAGMALAPAQAQDLEIDADDNETINGQLPNAGDGDVVRIIASEYDENVVINTANTGVPAGGSLTIQAAEDTDAGDSDVRIGQLAVEDNIDLTVERPSASNPGFFNIEGVTTPTGNFELELAGGTFTVNAPDVLEVFDGARARQAASASLSGNGPAYDGDAAVEIKAGSGSLDLTSGPTILPGGDVELNVEGSGGDVTFPSGLAVNEVSGDAPFGNPDVLDVGASVEAILNGGTVTGSTLNDGTITADGSVGFDAVTNNGTLTANATLTFDGSVDNSGTLTANAALTFNAEVTNRGFLAFQHSGETSSYDTGGTALDNDGGSGIEIESGSTLDVADSGITNNEGIAGAGTLEVSGDFIGATDGGPNEILADNSGSGGTAAGTIVADGATTFQDAVGAATDINFGDLDANASVTLSDAGSGIGEQTVGDIVAKNTGTEVFFSSSTSDVTTGSIETQDNAEVLLSNIGATVSTGALTANLAGTPAADANSLIDFNGTDDVRISGTITANGGADTDEGVNLFSVDNTVEITGDVTVNSGGNVDIGGSDVDLQNASLTQNSSGQFQTTDRTAITLSGDADDILDHNTLTTIGELTFIKSNSATATLGEAIEVNDANLSGDVTIDGNAALQDNVIMTGNNKTGTTGPNDAATFEVQGTIEQQEDPQENPTFLIFDGPVSPGLTVNKQIRDVGGTTQPSGIENIRVDGGLLLIDTDIVFERKLELLGGGAVADANDLIPADIENNPDFDLPRALVERDLSTSVGVIDFQGEIGSFNGNNNPYDLTYFASGNAPDDDRRPVQGEFNRSLQDFTMESGTAELTDKPQLTESGVVNGTLDIQSGAKLTDDDADAPRTLVLEGSNASIVGLIGERAGGATGTQNPVTLETRTDGTNITGSTDNANEARIDNLTVAASNVTVGGSAGDALQQIDGNVVVQEEEGLTLALNDAQGDDKPAEAGTDGDNDGTDDRTIEGRITVNGDLTLASTVETVNENGLFAGPPAVAVNDGVTTGTLSFGDNDLVFTGGSGAALLANSDNNSDTTPFSSTGGALVFDNNASSSQRIAASGEAIPRIKIESSQGGRFIVGGGSANGDFATTVQLDADEEIDLNGNTVEVSGVENDGVQDVILNANVTGSGNFRVIGTTVTAQQDLSISNFTVDGGSSTTSTGFPVGSGSDDTVTLESVDPVGTSDPFTVTVGTAFELASGSLDHLNTELQVNGTFAYTGSGGSGTEIEADEGFVDIAGGSFTLDNAMDATNLRVSSDIALGAEDLGIVGEMELDDRFDNSNAGDIVMSDGSTVQRLPGTEESNEDDPLADVLTVAAAGDQYNVTYGNGNSNQYNSDQELVSGLINTLTVNTSGSSGAAYLTTRVSTDNVVVDDLVLEDGDLDYGRQLEIDDGGTVTRRAGALDDDGSNNTADSDSAPPSALEASGTYTLVYDGADGDIDATEREFIADSEVSSPITLETTMGDAQGSNDRDVTIDLDRTVSSLTVDNVTDGSQTDVDGTLTVEDDADVTGGDLGGDGTVETTSDDAPFTATGPDVEVTTDFLALAGPLTVDDAAVTDNIEADVDGATTLENGGELTPNRLLSAGDITVESGNGTLGNPSMTLTFDGQKAPEQSLNMNGADARADSLTMAKDQGPSPVPQTTLKEGDILLSIQGASDIGKDSTLLDLNNGVLDVDRDEDVVDLGVGRYERESDPGFDPTEDTSHVAGNIVRTVGATGVGGGDKVGDRVDVTYPVGSANAAYRPIQFIFDEGSNNLNGNDITAGHTDPAPTPSNNLPITFTAGGETITIGEGVPNYYWRAQTDENIGVGNDTNFEIAVTTPVEGSGIDLNNPEPLDSYRILRQEEQDDDDYSIQGDNGQYDNGGTLQPDDEIILRNEASPAGLSPQGRRFAVGVPAQSPEFTNNPPTSGTVEEGNTLSEDFDAQPTDPNSGSDAIALSVDAPSSIEDDVSINNDGEFTFTPDFDDASGSPYALTVIAEDTEQQTTAELSYQATVNDASAPPAFTAPVSDEETDEGNTVEKTFQAQIQDPGSNGDVVYSLTNVPSEIQDSVDVDPQTGEFSYTAGFEDASASNNPTEYDVTARATDSDLQSFKDSTFTISVYDDPVAPEFTQTADDDTTDEGAELTADFTAEVRDPNSGTGAISYSVSAPSAIADSVEIDDTGLVSYTPDFDDAANDPYTLTVTAEDTDNDQTAQSSIQVTVENTAQAPEFTQVPTGPLTTPENTEETADFTAQTTDPNSGSGAISYSVSAPSAIADSVEIDDTGLVSYTPDFDDAANSPYTLTVTAEDTDAGTSASRSVDVIVTNVAQEPIFAAGSAPGDADPPVAQDTARQAPATPASFKVTAVSEDPSADQWSFDANPDWATASVTSTDADSATATVELTPGFDDAVAAQSGDGTLDVQVTATDQGAGEDVSGTATVEVDFDRELGDVLGTGSVTPGDARAALDIAVGQDVIASSGDDVIDANVRAADFVNDDNGLDADRGDVNSFDAFRIFQSIFGGSSVATQEASRAGSAPEASGTIRVGEAERKGSSVLIPIELSGEASGVHAADVTVDLGSGATVEEVTTNVPEDWMTAHDVNDGTLTLGVAGRKALSAGRIATVRLKAEEGSEPVAEGQYRLNDAEAQTLPIQTAPDKFALKANYPNPVRSATTIEYDLKESADVTLEVYNTIGQKVATLVNQEKQAAGSYSVTWEVQGAQGMASGVYFYRIEAGEFTESRRITVVR